MTQERDAIPKIPACEVFHPMRLVNWNVEWATPGSVRGRAILDRIVRQEPEIVCLTEGDLGFLPQDGYAISSEADYGYPLTPGRRKVILWSRTPWEDVDPIGDPAWAGGGPERKSASPEAPVCAHSPGTKCDAGRAL